MRTALCIAIGLAVPVSVVPASLAHGKSAETGTEAKERQTHQRPESNSGISIAEPIGRVSVGPKLLDGEPIYVRRTTVREGMTIVEVSTAPFMPDLPSGQPVGPITRPDQPAPW